MYVNQFTQNFPKTLTMLCYKGILPLSFLYTTPMNELIQRLEWRYATKKFTPEKKLSQDDVNYLKRAIQLAPSASGIQPYQVLIIEDATIRQNLRQASKNQAQVVDASHLFVFCSRLDVSDAYLKQYVAEIDRVRTLPPEKQQAYFERLKAGIVRSEKAGILKQWIRSQCFIALGFLLSACAVREIDACPMGGFDPEGYDALLGLSEKGLTATVLATVGYRSVEDSKQHLAKVRIPTEVLFQHI